MSHEISHDTSHEISRDTILTRKGSAGARGAGCCLCANQYWIPYQIVKINDCLRTGLAPESQ